MLLTTRQILLKNQNVHIWSRFFLKKGLFKPLIIENIDNRAAAILKQEALSCGAELCADENVSRFKLGFSNAVLFATVRQLEILENKLSLQPYNLKLVSEQIKIIIKDALNVKKILKYKNKSIDLSKPVLMGIVNMDPNSFSGDGLTDSDKAANQAAEFEKFGAKIIDLGAESSRPGVKLIDADTEIKRLIPALKKIRKKVKVPIS